MEKTYEIDRLAYVPKDTAVQKHTCKTGEAVAYAWKRDGKPYAVVFLGRATKPFSGSSNNGSVYWFANEQKRRQFVAESFDTATQIRARKESQLEKKKAAREAGHSLAVGDVLQASWGYDQTNIDFYQVTRLVGSQSVEIREISKMTEDTGHMQGECVPAVNQFIGVPMRKKVSEYGERNSVSINSHTNAWKIKPHEIAGLKVYPSSQWTAYA